jgi:hypothetical protein
LFPEQRADVKQDMTCFKNLSYILTLELTMQQSVKKIKFFGKIPHLIHGKKPLPLDPTANFNPIYPTANKTP